MSGRLRCAVYTRKSTEEGLEQKFNSLDAQREACEAYILSQAGEGWTPVKGAYDDGGFSGGSMQRPALQRLLADIQRGLIDIIVVYKVDRLTRSLSDFAKMVDLFDAKGVSFVSVTQAFNTTTSMGRLTLNVLLSFAQFEREVTGERIRDKVAASKAKGLRMGGRPPLGYDIADGRLVVNEPEAERVRAAFARYLELGSTKLLAAEGVASKVWMTRKGAAAGGGIMHRGALGWMLRNEAYVGTTRHKDKRYPGTHPPIVDAALFAKVQEKLSAAPASTPSKTRTGETALLKGRVWDDRGNPMDQVHTTRRNRFYRYFVSRPRVRGEGPEIGSISRISVQMLESFLLERLSPMLAAGWQPGEEPLRRTVAAVRKVILSADQILVEADRTSLRPEVPGVSHDVPAVCKIRFEFHMRKRQGAVILNSTTSTPPRRIDRILLRAVVLARGWAAKLESGTATSVKALAREEGLCHHHLGRLLPLAYLAPDLTAAILEGRQPRALTLSNLTRDPLPLDWSAQRELMASI